MMLDQVIMFFQEWGWLMALFLFVAVLMAADFFPRVYEFVAHIESKYPHFETLLNKKEQELIDRYEFLPARIRNGFALIGGKVAWACLVTRMYRFMRERTKRTINKEETEV
ncbi:hypothetical protein [Brevibacillus parabrevis]|uniref:hypothetical protein n=1 Tax=Brevibacillus parabrevis TaxID=54914 RepID=UPI0024923C41|nr:hypothetical protein [Brevibacillus parabrevis]